MLDISFFLSAEPEGQHLKPGKKWTGVAVLAVHFGEGGVHIQEICKPWGNDHVLSCVNL